MTRTCPLAGMVGTTRSRVNFFMNKFKKLGFIDYKDGLRVHSSLLNIALHDGPSLQPSQALKLGCAQLRCHFPNWDACEKRCLDFAREREHGHQWRSEPLRRERVLLLNRSIP